MPANRQRSIGLLVLVAALLAGACTTPPTRATSQSHSRSKKHVSPKPSPTYSCKNVPLKAAFHYAKGLLTADRNFVRKVSGQAISYYRIRTNNCIERGAVDVRLENKTHGMVLAQARYGEIEVFTKTEAWQRATPAERAQVLFHEWYHVLQRTLTPAPPPPNWLIEGSAEWGGFDAADHFGYFPNMDLVREALARDARRPVKPIEKAKPFNPGVYSLYYESVDFLLRHHGGRERLRQFWKNYRPGESWKTAFRRVFKIAPDVFLKNFAKYRAAGFTE